MIINMDDVNYSMETYITGYRLHNDIQSVDDMMSQPNTFYIFYLICRYLLEIRFLDLELFFTDRDAYFLYKYVCESSDWPEMEERIRKDLYWGCFYEKMTGKMI